MELKEVIKKRRAYRSLKTCEIDDDLIQELAECASLAPSCYNNQPWRFVFVYRKNVLEKLFEALPKGNAWAKSASMIVAVVSKKDNDCVIKGREYYLFDTGMATAFLILRATDLGLVAHPIAGYNEEKVKEVLDIPEEMTVISLVIVGKKSEDINPVLSDKQIADEKKRPERLRFEYFFAINKFDNGNRGNLF